MTSAQVALRATSLTQALWVQQQFAQAGFAVGPMVGISFSITGSVAQFEQFFGVQAEGQGGRPFPGESLSLSALDPALQAHILAVLFTQPPAFGPGNP